MTKEKLVYIASPYAGDVESNVLFAKDACRYAIQQGAAPVAAHLLYPQLLDDRIPEEREAGLRMGLRVLEACDELWLCGESISAGMQKELEAAEGWGIPVRRVSRKEMDSSLEPEPGFPGMGMAGYR